MTNREKEENYAIRIREEYSPKGESDIDALRKLDKRVKRPAEAFAWTFGVLGAQAHAGEHIRRVADVYVGGGGGGGVRVRLSALQTDPAARQGKARGGDTAARRRIARW